MRLFQAVLLALVVLAAAPAAATDYLSGISDLPLPSGMKEETDKSTVFDSVIGRIVTAYAKGSGTAESVRDFYESTLPQLGWDETEENNWRRRNEVLKIDVLGPDAGPVTVTYTLSSDN